MMGVVNPVSLTENVFAPDLLTTWTVEEQDLSRLAEECRQRGFPINTRGTLPHGTRLPNLNYICNIQVDYICYTRVDHIHNYRPN